MFILLSFPSASQIIELHIVAIDFEMLKKNQAFNLYNDSLYIYLYMSVCVCACVCVCVCIVYNCMKLFPFLDTTNYLYKYSYI